MLPYFSDVFLNEFSMMLMIMMMMMMMMIIVIMMMMMIMIMMMMMTRAKWYRRGTDSDLVKATQRQRDARGGTARADFKSDKAKW
jgi:uncharacterized membrane protein